MRFLTLSLSILAVLGFSQGTHAQESQIHVPKGTNWTNSSGASSSGGESQIFIPKGTNWRNDAEAITRYLNQQSKTHSSNKQSIKKVDLSIVHPDYLDPEQFGLLMKVANSESGCFDYSPIEYESKYVGNYYLDIKLNNYRKTLKDVKNPHYECNQGNQVVSGMIVLNANDLREKGVQQIRFSNGNSRDAYNISYIENGIRFAPKSMVAFKATDLVAPDYNYIEYKYADKTLVTLQVPMALPSDDVAQAVRNLAYKYALTPAAQTTSQGNIFYFKDESGNLMDRLSEDGFTEFGQVEILRPYVTQHGRVGTPVSLKVFLAKPSVTL